MPATTDPLVSTEWLAAHISDPNVKVIDASFKMPGVLPLPKDDFLAMLAHELRNPLSAIVNAVGILDRTSSQEPTPVFARALVRR